MEGWVEPRDPESLEASNLFQSGFWCRFKEKFGWIPFAFQVRYRHAGIEGELPLFVHLRALLPGFSLAYIPFGPVIPSGLEKGNIPNSTHSFSAENSWNLLTTIGQALEKELPFPCHVVRFDLPWEKSSDGERDFKRSPSENATFQTSENTTFRKGSRLYRAPVDIQPPDTVVLDLAPDEEELLNGMKPKTRYNVRLAMKKGVEVRLGTVEDLELWYALYQETAARDRIAIHPYAYYRALFDLSLSYGGESPALSLFLAYYEGTLVGGILVALFKDMAIYLYGASSNRHRNVMASYLLQWEAMKWAKRMGARTYDLFGIPPREDPTHPMVGLYRFKTGFGGKILHRWGCWDYPIHCVPYGIYRQAERFRYWYHKVFRKRFP